MGDKSGIEWTDATWNPVTGCSHRSDGCRFCYAETLTRRFSGEWGVPDLPWTAGNAEANVILHPERLAQPSRWRRPRVIFVNSMSDLFHELVPVDFVGRVFNVMGEESRHTFQVLTKRPERAREVLDAYYGTMGLEPFANVWLGVSIESARHVDRADVLRETPAAHRFISAEPLLGPLVPPTLGPRCERLRMGDGARCIRPAGHPGDCAASWGSAVANFGSWLNLAGIDWLIAGGESGEHFAERPDRFLVDAPHRGSPKPEAVEWVRDLRDACAATGTRFMLKQWGGRTPKSGGRELDGETHDWTPPRATVAA